MSFKVRMTIASLTTGGMTASLVGMAEGMVERGTAREMGTGIAADAVGLEAAAEALRGRGRGAGVPITGAAVEAALVPMTDTSLVATTCPPAIRVRTIIRFLLRSPMVIASPLRRTRSRPLLLPRLPVPHKP
jgi:hypothetical protein